MDISGLFTGSFEALKRRFGLFVLLSLAPSLLSLALFVAAAVVAGGAALTASQGAMLTALVIVVAIFAVGSLVVVLAQLKMYGMMSQAAYEIAQGESPDFSGLLARTRGYLPRLLPVIGLFFGIMIALYLLIGASMWGMFNSVANGGDPGVAALGAVGLLLVLTLVAVPVSIILWTKLLYLVPSVAIEGLGGIEALRRSWSLTKGSFWRTFGYAVLPQLAVTAVLWVLNAIGQLTGGMVGAMPRNPSAGEALAYLLALIPVFTVTVVLQIVVQLFTSPFIQTYYTYMFIDQVRRSELPPQQPGFGGFSYTPQGPQPGQPEYPQPYPGQPEYGTPQPGQGAQYPGGAQQPPTQQYPGQPPQPGEPGSSQNQWPGQGQN